MEKPYLQTPSQTVGPYFAYALTPEQYGYGFKELANNRLVDPLDPEAIVLSGNVYDGEGQIIPDAIIELVHNEENYEAFGRFGTGTDPKNRFVFYARKPQPYGDSAPHFSVMVLMRGQLIHSYTRLYFEDEAEANAADPVLNLVPEDRRSTLLAHGDGKSYRFDIHMQGPRETVFFEF